MVGARRLCSVFLLVFSICTMGTSAGAQPLREPVPLPGDFAADGVYHDAPIEHALKLRLSTVAMYAIGDNTPAIGMGIGYGDPAARLRLQAEVGSARAGVGAYFVVIPLIDFAVGLNYTYSFDTDRWRPGVSIAVFRW